MFLKSPNTETELSSECGHLLFCLFVFGFLVFFIISQGKNEIKKLKDPPQLYPPPQLCLILFIQSLKAQ